MLFVIHSDPSVLGRIVAADACKTVIGQFDDAPFVAGKVRHIGECERSSRSGRCRPIGPPTIDCPAISNTARTSSPVESLIASRTCAGIEGRVTDCGLDQVSPPSVVRNVMACETPLLVKVL